MVSEKLYRNTLIHVTYDIRSHGNRLCPRKTKAQGNFEEKHLMT